MAKSKIIKELANGSIDTQTALKRTKVLLQELDNEKWIGDKVYASQLNLCECRSESSKRTTDWICWFYRIFNRSTSTFPGGA